MFRFPLKYAEIAQLYRQTVEQNLSVIAVAGVESKNGTTTLCQTLAMRAARSKLKTLLVDMNFASPLLHQTFGLGQIDWYPQQEEALPIQTTPEDNLWVLSAPIKNARRWEFRELETVRKCLDSLRDDFDLVIIDTSPLGIRNQGNVPPEAICNCADGTLLSVLTGVNTDSQIRDAYDLLQAAGVNLHGAILNDQYAPNLLSELIRETRRLERFFPKMMGRIQKMFRNSTLLNQDI